MSAHPSYLELDLAVLGAADAATAAHVETCERCRAHLGRAQQPLPLPEWARALGQERRSRWPSWVRAPKLVGLFALAATAAFLVIARPRPAGREELGAKGSPSVAVYVKRGAGVSLWDGRAQLSPGDSVQLKVAPEEFRRIAVASLEAGALTELYAGPLAVRQTSLLPQSWTLDARPGREVLLLVFSQAPLSSAELQAALVQLPRTRERWATLLELPKNGGEQ
jgi:hypothetical protein